jgi:hypothetical protein
MEQPKYQCGERFRSRSSGLVFIITAVRVLPPDNNATYELHADEGFILHQSESELERDFYPEPTGAPNAVR